MLDICAKRTFRLYLILKAEKRNSTSESLYSVKEEVNTSYFKRNIQDFLVRALGLNSDMFAPL
jgi:hypothetical protein